MWYISWRANGTITIKYLNSASVPFTFDYNCMSEYEYDFTEIMVSRALQKYL